MLYSIVFAFSTENDAFLKTKMVIGTICDLSWKIRN